MSFSAIHINSGIARYFDFLPGRYRGKDNNTLAAASFRQFGALIAAASITSLVPCSVKMAISPGLPITGTN